jgi:DNA-binding response OmpR family regulator
MPQASILVVEDDDAVQTALCATLRTLGFTPFHADSVDEAFKVLRRETIDAVTLDLTLAGPGGSKHSGLSLLVQLRATSEYADTPVLIFAGTFLSHDDEALARKHGAEILYKPQPYYELASHLNRLLGRT